jgi:hypothetical protein
VFGRGSKALVVGIHLVVNPVHQDSSNRLLSHLLDDAVPDGRKKLGRQMSTVGTVLYEGGVIRMPGDHHQCEHTHPAGLADESTVGEKGLLHRS